MATEVTFDRGLTRADVLVLQSLTADIKHHKRQTELATAGGAASKGDPRDTQAEDGMDTSAP